MPVPKALHPLIGFFDKIAVVDVGANPIDGAPPYRDLLQAGRASVVGFEPNGEALAKLNAAKGPDEVYLPHAIADGTRRTLHHCKAPGMTSLLKPNDAMARMFYGYSVWSEIVREEEIDTVRLDNVAEVADADLLKLDIQGGELMALQNATRLLSRAVAVQVEVEFWPIYENQPLFGDIDAFMRAQGFLLHTFQPLISRMFLPLQIGGDAYAQGSQILWTDAIYVKGLADPSVLSDDKLLRAAVILHDCYRSYDAALSLLLAYDKRKRTSHGAALVRVLTSGPAPYFRIV